MGSSLNWGPFWGPHNNFVTLTKKKDPKRDPNLDNHRYWGYGLRAWGLQDLGSEGFGLRCLEIDCYGLQVSLHALLFSATSGLRYTESLSS